MKTLKLIFQSSIGRKYVMAISGALLYLFVIGHMLGNLQIFFGKEFINSYAFFLKGAPELLWPARIGLLVLAILHVITALLLAKENRASRPTGYDNTKIYAASFASQTILFSGLIVLAFIVYHLLHFTFGVIQADSLTYTEIYKGETRHDVYKMMIAGFSNPWISAIYIICMGLLCLHLSHGISSMFQTLGWKKNAFRGAIDKFAKISALLIFLGNCAIPVAVLLKVVK